MDTEGKIPNDKIATKANSSVSAFDPKDSNVI